MPQLYHGNDPANQGWTYTGHNTCSHVAFYERDGVKADYYYTTGEPPTAVAEFAGSQLVAPNRVVGRSIPVPVPCSGAPRQGTKNADAPHAEDVRGSRALGV